MPRFTEPEEGTKISVPLTGYSPRKAEALLTASIPRMIPLDIKITEGGAEQCFDTGRLVNFKSAFANSDPARVLSMMQALCSDVLEKPFLMSEDLGLLAADRLFWDDSAVGWRYLVLMSDSADWLLLSEYAPDEIWSALFETAMASSAEAECTLQSVVKRLADVEFSVEGLYEALEAEKSGAPMPGEIPPEPEDGEEEEFRPWENNAGTGTDGETPAETAWDLESEEASVPTAEQETPEEDEAEDWPTVVQPLIPGVEPPPPPTRSSSARLGGKVVSDGATVRMAKTSEFGISEPSRDSASMSTVHLKPETSVLSDPVVNGRAIGQVPVTKIKIPRVLRLKTGEMAYVDPKHFVIGSKAGAVDFRIQGSTVISRRHAEIVTRGSDYFLVDLGSKNGVFVNGKRISPQKETPIYVGDVFVLADEKFRLQW